MQSADPLADLLILGMISTPTFRGFRKDYVFPGRDLFFNFLVTVAKPKKTPQKLKLNRCQKIDAVASTFTALNFYIQLVWCLIGSTLTLKLDSALTDLVPFLQITHIHTQEMQMFMTKVFKLMHMLLHNFLISRVYGHPLVIRLSFSKIQTHYTQF